MIISLYIGKKSLFSFYNYIFNFIKLDNIIKLAKNPKIIQYYYTIYES